MIKPTFRVAFCVVLLSLTGAAFTQESETDAGTEVDDSDTAFNDPQKCFNTSGFQDINVMSDQHVYVQTRGGNHYLITTEECKNLLRAYRRNAVRFIPYGRTVCQNDGSYLVYENAGRESTCPIVVINRVETRAEARAIADDAQAPVEIEEITPAE